MNEEIDFILQNTSPSTPSLVPEITLQLATECTPLWQMTEDRLKQNNLPPPFWAFAWPGGQGMSRYILENPSTVKGKRVLDFAAGSGVAAIAAMKAGARSAVAAEIDPLALASIQINANLNHVKIETSEGVDFAKACKDIDVILAGDVCYQQAMAARLMKWLWLNFHKGIKIYIADPGRAYVPHEGLKACGQYVVPTSRDLEDSDNRTVTVYELVLPAEEQD